MRFGTQNMPQNRNTTFDVEHPKNEYLNFKLRWREKFFYGKMPMFIFCQTQKEI